MWAVGGGWDQNNQCNVMSTPSLGRGIVECGFTWCEFFSVLPCAHVTATATTTLHVAAVLVPASVVKVTSSMVAQS
jgi:hypothetical protein